MFQVSRRQPKNLKQHLTKAKFSSTPSKATTVTKCNEPRCGTCSLITTGESITFKSEKNIENQFRHELPIKEHHICHHMPEMWKLLYWSNWKPQKQSHGPQRANQTREVQIFTCYWAFKFHATVETSRFALYNCYNNTRLSRESKEKEIISILKPDLNT